MKNSSPRIDDFDRREPYSQPEKMNLVKQDYEQSEPSSKQHEGVKGEYVMVDSVKVIA